MCVVLSVGASSDHAHSLPQRLRTGRDRVRPRTASPHSVNGRFCFDPADPFGCVTVHARGLWSGRRGVMYCDVGCVPCRYGPDVRQFLESDFQTESANQQSWDLLHSCMTRLGGLRDRCVTVLAVARAHRPDAQATVVSGMCMWIPSSNVRSSALLNVNARAHARTLACMFYVRSYSSIAIVPFGFIRHSHGTVACGFPLDVCVMVQVPRSTRPTGAHRTAAE